MSKKQEFKAKATNSRGTNWLVVGIVVMLGMVATGFYFMNAIDRLDPEQQEATVTRGQGGDYNIGQQLSYEGQMIGMTQVELEEAGSEQVTFPLTALEEHQLISTEYMFNSDRDRLPLTAYVSPAGRVVVAVAVCEPCQSESFHIRGDELVCDACATKWSLNDLEGISGGCMNYPPDEVPYTVVDGNVLVDKAYLESWQHREL